MKPAHACGAALMGAVVALASAAALPAWTHAQVTASATIPMSFRTWQIEPASGGPATEITQVYVPVILTLHAGVVDFLVTGGGAVSRRGLGDVDHFLYGSSAISTEMFVHLADRRLVLQGLYTPPSGERELQTDQVVVSQGLDLPLLGFPLRQYGQGYEAGGSGTMAFFPAPDWTLSLGGGGKLRGSYVVREQGLPYRPASEWVATLGAEGGRQDDEGKRPLRIDATYRTFGKDQVNGVTVFEEGAQVELQLGARGAWMGMLPRVSSRLVLKGENQVHEPDANLVPGSRSVSGDGWFGNLALEVRPSRGVRLGVSGAANRIWGSDLGGRNGSTFAVGPSFTFALGDQAAIQLESHYLWGELEASAGSPRHDLHGYSAGVTLHRQGGGR